MSNLLRLWSLAKSYIAAKELRELRDLVRHRRQLANAIPRSERMPALLAKHGVRLPASRLESQPATPAR